MCKLCNTERKSADSSKKVFTNTKKFYTAVVDYIGELPCTKCTKCTQLYRQNVRNNQNEGYDQFIMGRLWLSYVRNIREYTKVRSKMYEKERVLLLSEDPKESRKGKMPIRTTISRGIQKHISPISGHTIYMATYGRTYSKSLTTIEEAIAARELMILNKKGTSKC